jgi:asparagine synthase (glutamine-hydrolysing)
MGGRLSPTLEGVEEISRKGQAPSMCGITGITGAEPIGPSQQELLKKMCDVIVHRGPDDVGYYYAKNAALGIRRLSIIDLQTGHQPILNEDGSLAVVLNGEIYNYRELRSELQKRGHRFATQGDTETIVHAYEVYGEECVSHLRGMFCFALWDEKRQKLLLARDRVGIKQLYYSQADGRFAFGSEIKCLLQLPGSPRRVNPAHLAAFLTFLYVPAPGTIYQEIFELPPAHYLVWERGRARVQRYWKLTYQDDGGHTEDFYIEGLLSKLTDAVRSHLVSDVPLGAFLSGGIDSGTVVALMSAAMKDPVETFTVGFEGNYGFYDEREDAGLVARRYNTNHHEFLVRPDLSDVLRKIVCAFDQPHGDSSAVPNYYICKMARTRVTVALSGMGGDEMVGGYERYLGVLLGDHYRTLPAVIRRAVRRGISLLPDWGGKGRISAARLKRFVRSAERDAPMAYLQLISTFDQQELGEVLDPALAEGFQNFAPEEMILETFQNSGSASLLNNMLYTDVAGYLPGDLLPLTDRMSMAHSLEVRVPFLDHELLEFAATIPPEMKIRRLTKKFILKKAAANLLPEQILHGKKRGFSIPLALWLRGELKNFVSEQLSADRVSKLGYFNPKKVSALLQEHNSGRANHENKIWALLVFTLWHGVYMSGTSGGGSA